MFFPPKPSRYWDGISLKAQVGHRLGPQPQFLRAAQVHQAPIDVAKRPGGAFTGGNVQTNGRNIVNMAPPGPGVSTRGKLRLIRATSPSFNFNYSKTMSTLGLGLNSAISGDNKSNQGNNNNNLANLNPIANNNAVFSANTNNANVVNIQPPG